MCKKINGYTIELEKKIDKNKKQNKFLLCLYCKNNIVLDLENSNLCEDCKKEFGHRYLREL